MAGSEDPSWQPAEWHRGKAAQVRQAAQEATTRLECAAAIFPNLAAEMTLDRPNQLWVADLTYIAIATGFVYLAAILDAWSRRVVGYAISRSIDARLAVAALKAAIRARRPPRSCVTRPRVWPNCSPRLPPVGVHDRPAPIRAADGRGLGHPAARQCRQGPPARGSEAAPHHDRLPLRLRRLLGASSDGQRYPPGESGLAYPRFVAGERNAPPEDCGGIPGFYETLEAAADPTHENHAEAKQWLDDYDPDTIEELPIKYALGRIAARRRAVRARLERKPSPRNPATPRYSPDGYDDRDRRRF